MRGKSAIRHGFVINQKLWRLTISAINQRNKKFERLGRYQQTSVAIRESFTFESQMRVSLTSNEILRFAFISANVREIRESIFETEPRQLSHMIGDLFSPPIFKARKSGGWKPKLCDASKFRRSDNVMNQSMQITCETLLMCWLSRFSCGWCRDIMRIKLASYDGQITRPKQGLAQCSLVNHW